ncbi:MAG: metallophosphoesterase [Candidatus Thorarchaeota archaeon]
MEARIAHISDTHLGTRFREGVKHNAWRVELRSRLLEHDFYDRFEDIFAKIANLDPLPDLVVHAGDLYDSPWENNPSQPPVVAQETALSVMQEFIKSTGVPILIIEGNHGLYRTLDVSLLNPLEMSIPGLDVATQMDLKKAFANGEPLVHSYDELDVYCFPFLEHSVLEKSNNVANFNDWILTHQKPDSNRLSIGVAHGMTLDKSLYEQMFSVGYDYIALGHDHHQHKYSDRAWYAGSPERWRFDEVKHKKGFLVIDLESGKKPNVHPHHLEFSRPVYNERIEIEKDDTIESIIEHVEGWLVDKGIRADWNPDTAARVRLIFQGNSAKLTSMDLNMAMETLRMRLLSQESGYNLVQLVWSIKQEDTEHVKAAYPEIQSEYLIEDPEKDFQNYLDTLELDESLDVDTLVAITVKALRASVNPDKDKLVYDDLLEEGTE